MNINVQTKSGLPIYEQIERQIKDMIVSGGLKEGEMLPSIRTLAADSKISVITVKKAYEDLEQEGTICGYYTLINWDNTDEEKVDALIEVNVNTQRDMGFDAIARRIYRFDEVKSVYLMSGSYDLLVLVESRTLKELAAFVSGKLSPLETVTGTATSFVLKRYKEEGVIFESDDTDRRLVISP